VELGAGLGLTGLTAAACAGSTEVVLTDCAAGVLKNLEDTILINETVLCRADEPCTVTVVDLDWMIGGTAAVEVIKWADLIIAADVLYDPAIVPYFVDVVEALLATSPPPGNSSAGQTPVAVVGATLRNPATLALFIELVRKRDIPIFEGSLTSSVGNEMGYWEQRPFDYELRGVRLFSLGGMPDGEWVPLREGPLGLGAGVTEVEVTWTPRF
jgi:hypothetical protein